MATVEQIAERLGRRYGELMNVEQVAHLFNTDKATVQRWLVVSPDFRALRARGRKHGRRVYWTVIEIAEFLSCDVEKKDAPATHLKPRGNANRTPTSRRRTAPQAHIRPNATRAQVIELNMGKRGKE